MILQALLNEVETRLVSGDTSREITDIIYDSRKVVPGSVYVAIAGVRSDGHDYLKDAVNAGAVALVVKNEEKTKAFLEEAALKEDGKECQTVTVVYVEETRRALALLSAAYFGHPEKRLTTIGITGTKGKTTAAYMVYSVLMHAGIKAGLIGTIETLIGQEHIASDNTTPISYLLYQYFDRMVKAGCTCVVMEVSSQGLMQYRVEGVIFDYAVLTNIEPDHIGPGEHASFEEYMACKGRLFSQCRLALVNADDAHWKTVLKGSACPLKKFGIADQKDGQPVSDYALRAENIHLHTGKGDLAVAYHLAGEAEFDIQVNIPGKFTVYNSMTAAAICLELGIAPGVIKEALLGAKVRGRVEPVPISDKFTVMVDYAHNAMSLKSLLTTIREYHPKRLVCLFGCGGNRSRDRRFEMGEISSRYADLTVVTTDNPRYEKPEDIIEDIITGVKKADGAYIAIPDRMEAIQYCIKNAQEGDVIIIAGKGHEDYQEICGVKHHMDDRKMVLSCKGMA
ncbi:MAG: UDP-N-acetylmuramoyl-L-alanyl-D-glutamate--2,6-diaminopimelate ligase [Lachnospiraceae bacterium]|nr:UDP-N-acetylmuramoyl-L-alanyl-D-glutamate--2,6-diaminopimelate ligase [Lachnospiraceae bacterium]